MKYSILPQFLISYFVKNRLNKIEKSDPDRLLNNSEGLAIKAFKRAAEKVPAYKILLKENGISPQKIKTIEDFKRFVPIIDKGATFIKYEGRIKELCIDGSLKRLSSILTSSGHSGRFSFGLEDRDRIRLTGIFIDSLMDYHIGIKGKDVLLINCLPMGVKVPSHRMTVSDVSVRSDMALSIIKNFGRYFDKVILVGENLFIKSLLEEGVEKGLDLNSYDLRIIVGEEGFPENYRSYIANLLGKDIDKSDELVIASSMGISEIGLMVFQETLKTIRLRRRLLRDKNLRKEFLGEEDILPMIFRYFPKFTYVEAIEAKKGKNFLIITSLDMEGILPLIRYRSGDLIRFIDIKKAKAIDPDYNHPSIFLYGREEDSLPGEKGLTIEKIKEMLYNDLDIPSKISGFFKVDRNFRSLKIQLNRYCNNDIEAKNRILDLFSGYGIDIKVFKYEDFPFPLDFERKWIYFESY